MPPMTRSRASQPGDEANDLMASYYAQRAGGLLGGRQPVSSPIQAEGVNVFIAGDDGSTPGFVQASTPRALT